MEDLLENNQDAIVSKITKGALAGIGIDSPARLLLNFPVGYIDCTNTAKIESGNDGMGAVFSVVVTAHPSVITDRLTRVIVPVSVDGVAAKVVAFGFAYPWKTFRPGQRLVIKAKLSYWQGSPQLENPEIIEGCWSGRIMPIYRGKPGKIAKERVRHYVTACLEGYVAEAASLIVNEFEGLSETELLTTTCDGQFATLQSILMAIHAPTSLVEMHAAKDAIKRIAAFDVCYKAQRMQKSLVHDHSSLPVEEMHVQRHINSLPYMLTEDQRSAINDIILDLRANRSMYRLLSGDVGFGKSAVMQVTAFATRDAGAKVTIMTPSTLLVKQLAEEFTAANASVPVVEVTGKTKLHGMDGNPILIGTTALLGKLKEAGYVPDYLIVDEQEKFSCAQREVLASMHTNILEATATCIPRTGALITHGIMDVSLLRISPVKKNITTRLVRNHQRQEVMEHVKDAIKKQEQVAIIYPLVTTKEQSEGSHKKHTEVAFEWWNRNYPGMVGMIHGKMKQDEKDAVIANMKKGDINILVSSTVIERGITLPLLRTAVVVDAWRYGVSQLHQIRGRLARAGGSGSFFMLADKADEDALARLELLEQYSDGFSLAEMDMRERGVGDISDEGVRQHGAVVSELFAGIKITLNDVEAFV